MKKVLMVAVLTPITGRLNFVEPLKIDDENQPYIFNTIFFGGRYVPTSGPYCAIEYRFPRPKTTGRVISKSVLGTTRSNIIKRVEKQLTKEGHTCLKTP